MFKFSERSTKALSTAHKDLTTLANEVIKISKIDFAITEGLRTAERQQELYKQGKSQRDGVKLKSKHQTGNAIDIMCYDINNKATWDKKYYYYIAGLFQLKTEELNIKINWGGWWKSFEDCPHFELE